MFIIKVILTAIFLKIIKCANILYLVSLPSPSHHIWNRELINSLATHGHNITVLAPDFDSNPPERVHYLRMDEIYNHKELFELLKGTFKIKASANYMSSTFDMNIRLDLCGGQYFLIVLLINKN